MVVVIGENKDLMFAAIWIVPLSLKSLIDGQKFCIVGFIISFSRNHFSKKVGHWVLLAIIRLRKNRIRNQLIKSQLTQDTTYCIV